MNSITIHDRESGQTLRSTEAIVSAWQWVKRGLGEISERTPIIKTSTGAELLFQDLDLSGQLEVFYEVHKANSSHHCFLHVARIFQVLSLLDGAMILRDLGDSDCLTTHLMLLRELHSEMEKSDAARSKALAKRNKDTPINRRRLKCEQLYREWVDDPLPFYRDPTNPPARGPKKVDFINFFLDLYKNEKINEKVIERWLREFDKKLEKK
jgi:hypothetical protein